MDVEVASMHRTEQGRLKVDKLSYKSEVVELDSKQLVIPNLYQYLSARFIEKEWGTLSFIEIDSIRLRIPASEPRAQDRDEHANFPVETIQELRRSFAALVVWLPPVSIKTFGISSPQTNLELSELELVESELSTVLVQDQLPWSLTLNASLVSDADWALHGALTETALTFEVTMEETQSGYAFVGAVRQLKEVIELNMEIAAGESLPQAFGLHSSGFTLGDSLLSHWRDWNGGSIELQSIQIDWAADGYTGLLALSGILPESRGVVTPFEGRLELVGDFKALTVESLKLSAPWVDASLSRPITLRFENGFSATSQVEGAELDVAVDLSKQPFIEAEGQVEAHVWMPADLSFTAPILRFELIGNALAYAGEQVRLLQAAGTITKSTVLLESASIFPDSKDDSVITLDGQIDLSDQALDLRYDAKLMSDYTNQFLETPIFSEQLRVKGTASGSWVAPALGFEVLETSLNVLPFKAMDLKGSGRIENLNTFEWTGVVESGGARVRSKLKGRVDAKAIHLEIDSLNLSDAQLPELILREPVSIDFDLGEAPVFERLSISSFDLSGVTKRLSGALSPDAGLRLEVSDFSFNRLNRWLREPLPAYEIESFTAQIDTFDPFLSGELSARTSLRLPGEIQSTASLQAKLGKGGVTVETARLTIDEVDVVRGGFTLPIHVSLPSEGGKPWQLLNDTAVSGKFYAKLVPAVTEMIRDATGISIASGSLEFDISESLQDPAGVLQMSLFQLDMGKHFTEQDLPMIDSIHLQARVDSKDVEVSNVRVSLNQSELEGSMALPVESVTDWLSSETRELQPVLNTLTAELKLKDWKMENWVDLMPELFRRSGSLSGSVAIKEGFDLSGFLELRDFALRPTESFSSIDQIGGKLLLANKRFELQSTSARVGGSKVAVSGWVDIGSLENPLWDVKLFGENVPVFRTTDMILRSDVDLEARRLGISDKPQVKGRLDLRASTLLVEFDPLGSSIETGPGLRPPFFSINQEPINDWLFDVTIFGEAFMRVRSPYFKTQLSADFHLGGSFQFPELVGTAQTVDGELRFPGTKMFIEKGEAFIEPSRPDAVQLDFTGTAQSASHTITMEIVNTLNEPHIQFHSTPELSNASILRLLATGTTTGGGAGAVGLYLGKGLLGAGGMNESIMDRLTIDFGEERSRSGRQTLGARFDLGEDWYLNGEYDQFDAYNMNIIWNLFKR